MWGVLKEPTSASQMHGLVMVRKLDQLWYCFHLSLKNLFKIAFSSPEPAGISSTGVSLKQNIKSFHGKYTLFIEVLPNNNCLLKVPVILTEKTNKKNMQVDLFELLLLCT